MDSEPDDLPVEAVTADQIVAINLKHFRRAAGLTQNELGAILGWSGANMSAIESSAAEGRERRRFDAQTLTELSLALGVPVTALLLPPAGDGTEVRYVIKALGEQVSMADYMERCVLPDSDEDSLAMDSYRDRIITVMNRYFSPEYAARAAAWLRDLRSPAERADLAERLRDRELALLETASELRELARAIMKDAQ